jgi:Arm domain-containing DNA-binding protein/integrase-like protein
MKAKGRHPEKTLSAVKVRNLSNPGRYADGNGLYLVVDPSGAKRWLLRTVVRGKRCDIGLGGLSLVSLAEARETALQFRKIARSGGDPIVERRKAQAIPTFEDLAKQLHMSKRPEWRNPKHAAQWLSTLKVYACPKIGRRRVDDVDTDAVLSVLRPIWEREDRNSLAPTPANRSGIGLCECNWKAPGRKSCPLEGLSRSFTPQTFEGPSRKAPRRPGMARLAGIHG